MISMLYLYVWEKPAYRIISGTKRKNTVSLNSELKQDRLYICSKNVDFITYNLR